MLLGDTFVVKVESLDDSLWKCGGAAIGLKLVDLAEVNFLPFMRLFSSSNQFHTFQTPHGLSRTLGILMDGLKNSWQNSEDMERMRE